MIWKSQNISRLFPILAEFLFTASEIELDHYYQKVGVRVAKWVAERVKTYDLRKLRNFCKNPEMLGFDGEYPADYPKGKFWHFDNKIETFHRKTVLLNLMNLPTIYNQHEHILKLPVCKWNGKQIRMQFKFPKTGGTNWRKWILSTNSWQPSTSYVICLKHFDKKYIGKGDQGKRFCLNKSLKPIP